MVQLIAISWIGGLDSQTPLPLGGEAAPIALRVVVDQTVQKAIESQPFVKTGRADSPRLTVSLSLGMRLITLHITNCRRVTSP